MIRMTFMNLSTLSRVISLHGSPAIDARDSGRGESSLNAPAAPAPFPYQLGTEHPQDCPCNQCAWNRGLKAKASPCDLTWRDSFAFFCGYWAGAVSGIAATVVVGLIALMGLSFT